MADGFRTGLSARQSSGVRVPRTNSAARPKSLNLSSAACRFLALSTATHSSRNVPLGTGYQLDVLDGDDRPLLRCKAKVAAKQERWVGLRFLDFERSALQALRAEIAKLSGGRGE